VFGGLLVDPPRVLEAPPQRSMQAKAASLVKGAKWQPGVADAALHIQHMRCGHVSSGGQIVGAGGSGQVARVRRDFFLAFFLPASLLEGPIPSAAVPARRLARARLRPEMTPLAIAVVSIRTTVPERRTVPAAQGQPARRGMRSRRGMMAVRARSRRFNRVSSIRTFVSRQPMLGAY
jgi:hypothetical protein